MQTFEIVANDSSKEGLLTNNGEIYIYSILF